MENTVKKLERIESSAVRASDKGFCSEASGGAAGRNPVKQGTGETPLIGEEHLSCGKPRRT
jgi:hypothetical protein